MQLQYNSLKVVNDALNRELERIKIENNELLNKNKQLEMSLYQAQGDFENKAKEAFSSKP